MGLLDDMRYHLQLQVLVVRGKTNCRGANPEVGSESVEPATRPDKFGIKAVPHMSVFPPLVASGVPAVLAFRVERLSRVLTGT